MWTCIQTYFLNPKTQYILKIESLGSFDEVKHIWVTALQKRNILFSNIDTSWSLIWKFQGSVSKLLKYTIPSEPCQCQCSIYAEQSCEFYSYLFPANQCKTKANL